MSGWGEVFLGVIAAATLAMAIVLVGVLVAAARLARQVGRLLDQVEGEVKPIFDHLNAIGRDASRAAAIATAQVERIDKAINDLAARFDQSVRSLHATVGAPIEEGRAILAAVLAALHSVRVGRARSAGSEEEDALFI